MVILHLRFVVIHDSWLFYGDYYISLSTRRHHSVDNYGNMWLLSTNMHYWVDKVDPPQQLSTKTPECVDKTTY